MPHSPHSQSASLAATLLVALCLPACQPAASADRTPRADGGPSNTGGMGTGGGAGGNVNVGSGGTSADVEPPDTGVGGEGGAGQGGDADSGAGGSGTGGVGTGGVGAGGSGTGGSDPVDMAAEMPPPPPRTALLVVGDPRVLTPGDTKLKGLLEAASFTVTVADDDASAAGATGKTLVVLTSTSVSATLAAKYRNVTVPVVNLEASVMDDMNMTGPTKTVDYDEDEELEVLVLPGMQFHPLADGLANVITVASGGPQGCCGLSWGKPTAAALLVASWGSTNNPARTAIFAYERGVKMFGDFLAPARRVGIFAADTSAQHLTPYGSQLVSAAFAWAIDGD